jgi:hypothetical protein
MTKVSIAKRKEDSFDIDWSADVLSEATRAEILKLGLKQQYGLPGIITNQGTAVFLYNTDRQLRSLFEIVERENLQVYLNIPISEQKANRAASEVTSAGIPVSSEYFGQSWGGGFYSVVGFVQTYEDFVKVKSIVQQVKRS